MSKIPGAEGFQIAFIVLGICIASIGFATWFQPYRPMVETIKITKADKLQDRIIPRPVKIVIFKKDKRT